MLRLQDTNRFAQDVKRYELQLKKINDVVAQERGRTLLTELKQHCHLIDEAHNSRNNGYIDPRTVRDNIERSVAIRRELNLIIKDSREG
jgi:hypothetical protein